MTNDFEKSNQVLEILSSINLDSVDANKRISFLIKNRLIVPYILTSIPKGFYLYRARENQNGQEFTKRDQISYNKNKSKINPGRVNSGVRNS